MPNADATQPTSRSVVVCAWSNVSSARVELITIPGMDSLGRSKGTATAHVLPEYAERFQRYLRYRSKYSTVSYLIMATLVAILVLTATLRHPNLMGVVLVIMASVMWVFPFATPPAVEALGARKSIAVVRIGAAALGGCGMWYFVNDLTALK